MLYKMFAMLDIKSKSFTKPILERTVGIAVRSFKQAANDPSTQLNAFPTDFALYEIGTYDDETGKAVAYEDAIPLGFAYEYIDDEPSGPTEQVDIEEFIANQPKDH